MRSKIAILTVIYAHVLLIPWIDLLPPIIYRYGPFLLSVLLIISINNAWLYIKSPKDKFLGFMLFALMASTIVTSISVNEINVDSVLLDDSNKLHYENNGIAFGITTALKVFFSFIFVQYVIDRKNVGIFIIYLYYVLTFYIIISDLDILINGIHSTGSGYLLGNKFTVSYLHVFWAIIYNVYHQIKKTSHNYYVPLLCLALIVAVAVRCSTSVVGILLLFAFQYIKILYKIIPYSRIAFILLITGSILFAFFYAYILEIPFVQYFIVNVLGEDLTLTGRIYIYNAVINVIELNPLWGMGIGNSYQLLSYLFGYPNAQNGFINLFLEQGLVGCLITMIITLHLVNKQRKQRNENYTTPIVVLIFIMIFLALVEITIDLRYVFLLTILQITDYDIKQSAGLNKKVSVI
ncbi:putative uncharacterized protein [Bacteroides sp. CAG:702]|nr:putative uncharacterized protein [Bacteroides sp. CAG:702]